MCPIHCRLHEALEGRCGCRSKANRECRASEKQWPRTSAVSAAEHRIFYPGLRDDGRRLQKEGSRDAGEMSRKLATQKRKLPWRLQERPAAKRAGLQCREGRRKSGR